MAVNSRNIGKHVATLTQQGQELGLLDEAGFPALKPVSNPAKVRDKMRKLIKFDMTELIKEADDLLDSISQRPELHNALAEFYYFSSKQNPKVLDEKTVRKNYECETNQQFEELKKQRENWGLAEILKSTAVRKHAELSKIYIGFGENARQRAETNAVSAFKDSIEAKEDAEKELTKAEIWISEAIKLRENVDALVSSCELINREQKDYEKYLPIHHAAVILLLTNIQTSLIETRKAQQQYELRKGMTPGVIPTKSSKTENTDKPSVSKPKLVTPSLWERAKKNKKQIAFWMILGVVLTIASVFTFGAATAVSAAAAFASVVGSSVSTGSVAAGVVASVAFGATGGAASLFGGYHVAKDMYDRAQNRRQVRTIQVTDPKSVIDITQAAADNNSVAKSAHTYQPTVQASQQPPVNSQKVEVPGMPESAVEGEPEENPSLGRRPGR